MANNMPFNDVCINLGFTLKSWSKLCLESDITLYKFGILKRWPLKQDGRLTEGRLSWEHCILRTF